MCATFGVEGDGAQAGAPGGGHATTGEGALLQVVTQVIGPEAIIPRLRGITRIGRIRVRQLDPTRIQGAAKTMQLLFGIKHRGVARGDRGQVIRSTHDLFVRDVVPGDLALAEVRIGPGPAQAPRLAGAGVHIAACLDVRPPIEDAAQVGADPATDVVAETSGFAA
jgi:hypothetical protein